MILLEHALKYLARGWSVIPLCTPIQEGRCDCHIECKYPGKIARIQWKPYQEKKADEQQICSWWKDWPDANIGIITGRISGLVVADFDSRDPELIKGLELPLTTSVRTHRGFQHYYKHPGSIIVSGNAGKIREHIDIRGDGNYVVAPPSRHAKGTIYEWVIPIEEAGFAELPKWALNTTSNTINKNTDWDSLLKSDHLEGHRNEDAAQLAGKLLRDIQHDLWEIAGWPAFIEYNLKRNKPPLEEKELKSIWESIKKAASSKHKKSQGTSLLEIVKNQDVILFHNEMRDPYVNLIVGDHRETWPCRNKMFKRWLAKISWDNSGKSPNSDALNTALIAMEGMACYEGREHKLYNRIALLEDAIWYDLSDTNWRAVKITSESWEVINNPPILFRRYNHQQSQIEPTRGGNAKDLLRFVNITDEDKKLLFLITIVTCFIPDFPHPLLSVYGAQGSAKSALNKVMGKLIDPSAMEVASFPKDSSELAQILSHRWFAPFDNISNLPNWVSDTLCKAVSGDGFSKRELYSDDDAIIYTFKRCISVNGVNLVITKPDLLERSILLELDRVPTQKRRDEQQMWSEFEQARPGILGGIFDSVSAAMKLKPSIKLLHLPRMADFAIWGCAIAEALGYAKEDFIRAYYANISSQNEEVLGESLVATVVRAFIEEKKEWNGTPSELLKELTLSASAQGVNTDKERDWPKAANALSKVLNELKTNLATDGIQFMRYDEGKRRRIHLQNGKENTVAIVESLRSGDGDDVNDGFSDILAIGETNPAS